MRICSADFSPGFDARRSIFLGVLDLAESMHPRFEAASGEAERAEISAELAHRITTEFPGFPEAFEALHPTMAAAENDRFLSALSPFAEMEVSVPGLRPSGRLSPRGTASRLQRNRRKAR